jgi:transposase
MILDLPVRPGLRILVTSRPVDFRRGMDSLSTLVKETLAADPFLCVEREYVAAWSPAS